MLGQIKWELDALQRRFPDLTVAQLKPENLKPFFERGEPSLKTYNNRRGLVGTFLKFAFQQNWILANPTERMPHFRIAHRRGSAVTLNAGQCAELMAEVEAVADGVLVPYFALCLFAGIRPSVRDGEISKLKACDINLDTAAGAISESHLALTATVPGISPEKFEECVADAKANCPISKLYNTNITVESSLHA